MGFDGLVVTETWLTRGISDLKFVGDITPAGYAFHHAARIHRKCGGVDIVIRDSLTFEKHSRFQDKSFENHQLTFIPRGVLPKSVSVRVATSH